MIADFSKCKKVHFIGIGGIGISAIARMFLLEGKSVSGSDRGDSEVTQELRNNGAKIYIGHQAQHIEEGTDLVIYTIAIPEDNPELVQAKKLGIMCLTYPQALGALSKIKYTIAVSGTHGKTTTTAMIAKVLIDAKLDPTVVVGSLLRINNTQPHPTLPQREGSPLPGRGVGGEVDHTGWSNFIAGKGKPARLNGRSVGYLVAEACEYRRSFLNLSPKILVITNIDDDHLDYYKDIKDIQSAFAEVVEKIPRDGYLVCNKELPYIQEIADKAKCTVVDYELFSDQNLKLKVPGEHNLMNAAAVLAVADILGISRSQAEKSLQEFSGTWRRFEFKGNTKSGALIYDDYGHHPTEIKATLKGARNLFPDKRIIALFQPHLFSRTKQHLEKFGKAFGDVDYVIVAPIYPAREPFDSSISSEMVAREIIKNGGTAIALPSFEAIETHLKKELSSKKDVLVTMGAGDVYLIGEKLRAL